jgi:hypothetical protein
LVLIGQPPLLQCLSLSINEEIRARVTYSALLPRLPVYPGLIVKDSYWRWPERNLAGNAIDFHVQVLGLSFHDAMRHITST